MTIFGNLIKTSLLKSMMKLNSGYKEMILALVSLFSMKMTQVYWDSKKSTSRLKREIKSHMSE